MLVTVVTEGGNTAASCTPTADGFNNLSINVEGSRGAAARWELIFDRFNQPSIDDKARPAPLLLAVDAPQHPSQAEAEVAGAAAAGGMKPAPGRLRRLSGLPVLLLLFLPFLPLEAAGARRSGVHRRGWGEFWWGAGRRQPPGQHGGRMGAAARATGKWPVPAERRPAPPGNPLSASRGLHAQGVGAARWDRVLLSRSPGTIRELLHLGGRVRAGDTLGFMSLGSDFGTRCRSRRDAGMMLC